MPSYLATMDYPKANLRLSKDTAKSVVALQEETERQSGIKPSISNILHTLVREALVIREKLPLSPKETL